MAKFISYKTLQNLFFQNCQTKTLLLEVLHLSFSESIYVMIQTWILTFKPELPVDLKAYVIVTAWSGADSYRHLQERSSKEDLIIFIHWLDSWHWFVC